MLEKLNHEQMQQVTCTLWAIWNGRTNEIHGEQRKPAQVATNFVKQCIDELNTAHAKEIEVQDQWRPSQRWRPLGSGRYKLNFEAVNKATKMGGIVVIIKNGEAVKVL